MGADSPTSRGDPYRHPVESIAASGAQWKISEAAVRETLARSVASWEVGASGEPVGSYLDSLHGEDLALAIACRCGIAPAWEKFIETYRPVLYSAARAICREEMTARELADSLWAELYGTEVRDGKRRSLLDYFHGRSSLKTWLRAILAQRHIDAIRAARRLEPLDNLPEPRASEDDPPEPGHSHLMEIFAAVLSATLAALSARERMRLGYYYRDGLTLREIAHAMAEHESTVSRKLERTRRELKRQVEKALRREHRMSEDQIRFCYDHAAEDAPLRLSAALSAGDGKLTAQRKDGGSF
jgi:RNA polymerase sigma-70 factor, ECF subfamily